MALASVAEGPEAEAEAGKGVGKGVGGVSGGGVKREKRGLKIFASTWNMGGGAFACMHVFVGRLSPSLPYLLIPTNTFIRPIHTTAS